MNLVEEFSWRGMIHDITPGTEKLVSKESISVYIGFDPTAASMHVGNLVTTMLLVHAQRAGHKPIALVGGATGMVGDPSGKSEERKFLSEEVLRYNESKLADQLSKFLRFDDSPTSAEVVNNYDWFKEIGFLQFLRDAGKHISVNYMMAKDSVKKRLETGISFTEFSYQLLQAYDFYWLYKNRNCKLQMGGSDQWGNITTGTELIRRMDGGEAFAMTTPLMTKADGSKFGKSEDGNVWLDAEMTSPYKFYQFWLNTSDEEAKKLIRILTFHDKDKIEALEKEHEEAPHLRALQKELGKDVTIRVHGEHEYEMALNASEILFSKKPTEALKKVDEKTFLGIFEGVPMAEISKDQLSAVESSADLLSELTNGTIFSSKGEAKRMIQGGGVSINKNKISEPGSMPEIELIKDKYLLIQKGKKNYYLIKVN